MRFRALSALLLLLVACATTEPGPRVPEALNPRIANLQRAATLPWMDEGRCVVEEASQPWPVLVERCFQALDQERIRFNDPTGRCAVASAGAAGMGLGICVLAAPEIVVGAVIVTGVVVVGFAIKEALDAYELEMGEPEVRPAPETRPVPETKPMPDTKLAPREPQKKRKPKTEPEGGPEFPPLGPPETSERERRPECMPIPVPHLGGNDPHDECADTVPNNSFPGWDVFVNGKNFDALQLATRTLWDVKTDAFGKHDPHSQKFFIKMKLGELQREARLAKECGYDFIVGVRSEAHKIALLFADPTLKVVVMDWC